MIAFEYAHPTSLDDAISLLADKWGETEVLAGGTDLITSLKQNITRPRLVVSLKNIEKMDKVVHENAQITIGALTPLADLINDELVIGNFPALVTAASIRGDVLSCLPRCPGPLRGR